MTKDEVKLLCETDEKLQWWAMVLFAEIVALVSSCNPDDYQAEIVTYVDAKVREFDKLVIQRSLERAKESAGERSE